MNPIAGIIMGAALLLYSVGVWSERIQGRLKYWHLILFVSGLICDTWGTGIMFRYAEGMLFSLHGISGVIAIILMFVHAGWALIVLLKKDESMITKFHRFSIIVWLVWLVPYLSPMFVRMLGNS
jgi:uncharacterized repeat protein (TIGR03987 family)